MATSDRPQLDLRGLEPRTAAERLFDWVRKQAEAIGQKPDIECALYSPEDSEARGYGKCWHVFWEAGPWEWATSLLMGCNMNWAIAGNFREDTIGTPEVVFDGPHYCAEPHYTFDIGFWSEMPT